MKCLQICAHENESDKWSVFQITIFQYFYFLKINLEFLVEHIIRLLLDLNKNLLDEIILDNYTNFGYFNKYLVFIRHKIALYFWNTSFLKILELIDKHYPSFENPIKVLCNLKYLVLFANMVITVIP